MHSIRKPLALLICLFGTATSAEQLVFLDFDTFSDGVSDDGKDYGYSPAEWMAIVEMPSDKLAPYPVTFTGTIPPSTEPPLRQHTTVFFNEGLSEAENIDFRNTRTVDDAEIHIPRLLEIAGLTAPFASHRGDAAR